MGYRLAVSACIVTFGISMCSAAGDLLEAFVTKANPHHSPGPYVRQGIIHLQNLPFTELVAEACGIEADAVAIAPEFVAPDGNYTARLQLPGAHEDTLRPAILSVLETAFGCRLETTSVQAERGRLVVRDSTKLVRSARQAASSRTAPKVRVDAQGNLDVRWNNSCEGCTIRQAAGIILDEMNGGVPVYGIEDDLMYDFEFHDLTAEQVIVKLRDVYGIEIVPETYTQVTTVVVKPAGVPAPAHN